VRTGGLAELCHDTCHARTTLRHWTSLTHCTHMYSQEQRNFIGQGLGQARQELLLVKKLVSVKAVLIVVAHPRLQSVR